tara:strand:- start:8849 stop:9775 length:927 start_codon:yes stop_codon:yes gene_type:complete
MRFKLIIFILFLFNSLSLNLLAETANKIVIKIGSEIITNYEIKNKILTTIILSGKEINQNNINALKKNSLDSLIEFKLKKLELSKYNFKVDKDRINSYLKSISSNDINNLKRKLEENELAFQLFLEEIETEFKWQTLIFQIYSKRINIDESAINIEINEIIKNKSNIEEYKLSEIEIFSKDNNSDKETISNLQKTILEEGFENVALNYSISTTSTNKGELGWVNGKTLSNQIYEIVSKLSIGEVSKPIKRPNTFLFLKLIDKKISKSSDIDIVSLKKNLIDQKKNELFRLYSQSHLSKLKNNNLIEYK